MMKYLSVLNEGSTGMGTHLKKSEKLLLLLMAK